MIEAGDRIDAAAVFRRLDRLQYREVDRELRHPGEYRHNSRTGVLEIHLHAFSHPGRFAPPRRVRIRIEDQRVRSIGLSGGAGSIDTVELEPEEIGGLHGDLVENRRVVALDEVPAILVHAVLAAEDRRFFDHPGIDVRGVARAIVANLRSGRVVQGGSTLTQQLVKNFFLTEARTVRRKVTEAVMALLVERQLAKLEILELYLNEIYLGQRGSQGIFGVWEASRLYFGKDPKDLTIGEAAMLAGLIKAPNRYAPTRHPGRASRRRDDILRALLDDGAITPGDYEAARREPLRVQSLGTGATDMPYIVDFVRAELEERFADEDLTTQGFRIFTTIDVALQRAAERAVVSGLERLERRFGASDDRVLEAALVALEPASGEIKAMVGGRDYARSQFNRATTARRQVGSVFKPIVFLSAFEKDETEGTARFRPTRRIEDEPFRWEYDRGRRSWEPRNYADEYFGSVSLRQALERSLNAATARVAREVGIERIRETAVRLGFLESLPAVPALSLGAGEATPLEIARAFAAVATLGFANDTEMIRDVLDETGNALEGPAPRTEQVTSPRAAYLVTSLMQGVLERGTGGAARRFGFRLDAAGKTGTTNDGRDAWFVGFTPDLVAVVWVGFDRGEGAGLTGAAAALPIWADFMVAATASSDPTSFLVPPGIDRVTIDPMSGALATAACPSIFEESFLSGTGPTEPCPLHATVPPSPLPSESGFPWWEGSP